MKTKQKQMILIDGVVGKLEIRVEQPTVKQGRWVVICHPHPKFGGSMDNKVNTTLQKSFQSLGYGTVTFNFRGVGQSKGEYDGGLGEQDDLLAVVDWLKINFELDSLILAGFSFGAYIAMKQAMQLQVEKLCVVAPAVGMYDFSDIKLDMDWVLIQGGEDEVICSQDVLDWSMGQPRVPDIYWRAESSHFFHRQLVWLKNVITLVY